MADRYENIRKALAMGPTPGAHPKRYTQERYTQALTKLRLACDPDTIRALLVERDALAAALEAAREDAERYRWLRKGASDEVAVVRGLGAMDYGMSAVVSTYSEEIDGDDLDAAIDRARRKENGNG